MPIGDLDIDIITRGEADDSDSQFDVLRLMTYSSRIVRTISEAEDKFVVDFVVKNGSLARVEVSRKLKIL